MPAPWAWRSRREGTAVTTDVETVSPLPPLYAPWIEEVLGGPAPEERHATCSACAMCEPTNGAAATASLTVFDPATKCCTYVPALPNFLVGMALNQNSTAAEPGRKSIEGRIAQGRGVTPLGLQADPEYALIYKHAGGETFGRTPGMRCPHYLPAGGQCGIWRHRNAVCATWFCKHERGMVGKRFWDALRQLLTMAERHLALWAAAELGEPLSGLGPALLPYYATVLDSSGSAWSSPWADRPREFYRASAGLVERLAWAEVRDIGGPELALVAGQLRAAHAALRSEAVPAYLRLGALSSFPRAGGQRAVSGYSPHDMPILPEATIRALDRFDGTRSTEQVCQELSAELGAPLERSAVLRLADFGVLGAVQRGEEAEPC